MDCTTIDLTYEEAVDYLLSLSEHRREIIVRLLNDFSKLNPEQRRRVLERAGELEREGGAQA